MKLVGLALAALLALSLVEGLALWKLKGDEDRIRAVEAADNATLSLELQSVADGSGLQACSFLDPGLLSQVDYSTHYVLAAYVYGVGLVPLVCPKG